LACRQSAANVMVSYEKPSPLAFPGWPAAVSRRRVAAAAAAAFIDGNLLYEYCSHTAENKSLNSLNEGNCLGYVEGVADVMFNGIVVSGWRACLPANVNIGQARDVVLKSLAAHPQWRHLSADSQVAQALAVTFPCPK
jgi:hypothetical protein